MNKKQDGRGGGERAAPGLAWQWAQKDGCAQRTGAHARPKPTSSKYLLMTYVLHKVKQQQVHGDLEEFVVEILNQVSAS